MWVVYIIQHNFTKELYIGFTNNLRKRIQRHNTKGERFTWREKGKWILVYAEAYRSRDDALQREQKLKHHGSAKHELYKRIIRSFLDTKTGAG